MSMVRFLTVNEPRGRVVSAHFPSGDVDERNVFGPSKQGTGESSASRVRILT